MTFSHEYYRKLDHALSALIEGLKSTYPNSDWSEVLEFIDHGEYGLAFESLCDEVRQRRAKLSSAEFTSLYELCSMMGLDESVLNEIDHSTD